MTHRWTLLLFLILALPVSGTFVSAQEAAPDRVFFVVKEGEGSQQAFTGLPPNSNDTGYEVQFIQVQDRSISRWTMAFLPADWETAAGEARALLYLRGLDEILPFPATDDPASATRAPAAVRIVVTVENASGERLVANGETSYMADPTAPEPSPRLVEVPLLIQEGLALEGGDNETADSLFVTITIHGRHATNVSPVYLHVHTPEHPSALVLPGFPYRTLYDRDLAEYEEQQCRQAILEKRECATERPPDGEDGQETEPTPLPVVLTLVSLGLVAALRERER